MSRQFDCLAPEFSVYYISHYRLIAHALLQSPQWPKAMRNTFRHEGKLTTPFRQLIRKMPGENS